MDTPRSRTRRSFLAAFRPTLLFLGAALLLPVGPARAADGPDQPLAAVLVWGTDEPKPADQQLKDIPADLGKRLRRVFKWKNYFEVGRTNFVVTARKPSAVDMSRDCRLEVSQQPGGEFEIQLFGKGKLVVRKRQRFVPGETIILAGDDKNENAWFVVMTPERTDAAH